MHVLWSKSERWYGLLPVPFVSWNIQYILLASPQIIQLSSIASDKQTLNILQISYLYLNILIWPCLKYSGKIS